MRTKSHTRHKLAKVQECDSRVRLGGAGSYLEVRLGQWQQENGLGHGWVAGLEDGRQEGRSLSLQDIRETVWCQLPKGWENSIPPVRLGKGWTSHTWQVETPYFITHNSAILTQYPLGMMFIWGSFAALDPVPMLNANAESSVSFTWKVGVVDGHVGDLSQKLVIILCRFINMSSTFHIVQLIEFIVNKEILTSSAQTIMCRRKKSFFKKIEMAIQIGQLSPDVSQYPTHST